MEETVRKPRNIYSRVRLQTEVVGKSMTQQNLKDRTDINNIMKKYEKTGLIEHVAKGNGQYGDFSQVDDFQSAVMKVQEATDAFMTLPASTRSYFKNDPGEMIEFLKNSDNKEKAIELGLVEAPIPEQVQKVEVINKEKKEKEKGE
jgi:phage internal scaffolding protein